MKKRVSKIAKAGDGNHCVVFWEAARIARADAQAAFGAVGMAEFLPPVDHYGSLQHAAYDIVETYNLREDGNVKLMPLSHQRDAVGVEVRRLVKGVKRNDLPFLFSLGVMRQPDGTFAVELLDVDRTNCPAVYLHKRTVAQKAHDYWEDACNYLSANDLTNAIVRLVRASCGFMLLSRGVIWAMPIDKLDAYSTVSKALASCGVSMQTLMFDPELNVGTVKMMRDRLIDRSFSVFNGQIEELEALDAKGGKPRKNGQQTRVEDWVTQYETLQSFRELLGPALRKVSQAARVAAERIGSEAIKAFTA